MDSAFRDQYSELEKFNDTSNGLVVILKKNDHEYVKLTNEGVFEGDNQTNIQTFVTNGKWIDESFNLDLFSKLKLILLIFTVVNSVIWLPIPFLYSTDSLPSLNSFAHLVTVV